MSKLIDLTGERFGRLKVIEYAGKDKLGKSRWLCRCDCGNKVVVTGGNLKSGNIKSCGCLRKEKTIQRFTKHGHYDDEIYRVWLNMKDRCTNSNNISYHNYGGRGITVCDEWLHSFTNFLRDNPGWKPGLTLERDNNKLGYFKDNCYWATPKQQARNKRDTLCVPYKGKNRLFIELCEEHNMPYQVVYQRYYKYKWPLEKALTTPIKDMERK